MVALKNLKVADPVARFTTYQKRRREIELGATTESNGVVSCRPAAAKRGRLSEATVVRTMGGRYWRRSEGVEAGG